VPRKWTEEQRREARERFQRGRADAIAKRREREAARREQMSADVETKPEWLVPPDLGLPEPAADDGVTITDGGPSLEDIRRQRRERLTGDLPADLAVLITDAELEKIENEEIEKAIASKKRQALADVRALASAEARIEHGLIPADVLRDETEKARLAERVRVKVNLPRGGGALGLRIDGRLFRHGQTYTVTRAEYESMHFTVYKTWLDEIRFRTLDQNERGRSAIDQISASPPQFEVLA
jgi:hypothetical protein